MPERHALLAASDASRWINCPPSVRLTEHIDDRGSEFAAEGTIAHSLAELRLRAVYYKEDTRKEVAKLKESKYYGKGMDDYITDYLNTVAEAWADLLATLKDEESQGIKNEIIPAIYFELQVDTSRYVPEGFGTADVVMVGGYHIHIIDLKYGKGQLVEVQDNNQLRLYALGVGDTLRNASKSSHVKMTICQPRLGNIETTGINYFDLERWGKQIIRPAAKAAYVGTGELKAGKHCYWCPIKTQCRTRAEYLLEGMDETPPEWLTGQELGAILNRASELENWLKHVGSYAVDRAMAGEKIEGYKLIEGKRGRRKIEDTDSAETILMFEGLPESVYMTEPKLKGITDLENELGRVKFYELLGDYLTQPKGSPKLAPESDRAPEWKPFDAATDFDDLEEELNE